VDFVVLAVVALLVDRVVPTLPDPVEVADRCEELPAYAPRRSATAYVLEGAAWIALFGAVLAGLTLWLGTPQLVAGVLAAMGTVRLAGVRRVHRVEQARHIRLSVRLGRGQRRKHIFYARPTSGSDALTDDYCNLSSDLL